MNFPRALTASELTLVRWLLPTTCSTYAELLRGIESSVAIGEGRWGLGDLMLGSTDTELDLTLTMAPIVAFGECSVAGETLSINIHELNVDDLIEIQFSGVWPIPENVSTASAWTYSYWKPGMPCPATGGTVREVSLRDNSGDVLYTLAISATKRIVWLHHNKSGYNQSIALTGFADEVFRTHNIRDAKAVTHPVTLFDRLAEFSDDDLRHACMSYNRVAKHKFDASNLVLSPMAKEKSLIARLLGRA